MEQALLILTNVPDLACARQIAHRLVRERLAACVNVLPGVQSVYRWQGSVEQAEEITLLIKSTQSRYADLESAIRAMHPYDLPEIVATPIVAGLAAYLAWISSETKKDIDV